jgi:hypothetical protein
VKLVHHEIEIYAPAEAVWEVLVDFDAYATWNPFIRRVAGLLRLGERVEACLQPSGQRSVDIHPTITRIQPNRELQWRSHVLMPFLLYGEHIFRLYPLAHGVLFVQRLRFGGIFASSVAGFIYDDTMRGFVEMNAALKVRVESFQKSRASSAG